MEGPNERIEDKAKAEAMAYDSDFSRTRESYLQAIMSQEGWTKDSKELFEAKADYWDKKAEYQEERAALEYDIRQEVVHLSDEELKNLFDEAYGKQMELSKELFGGKEHELNRRKDLDLEYTKVRFKAFILGKIIQERFNPKSL